MLTVTICEPLAAIASRITPKSLYFPVPTIRRELKLFPPMTSESLCMSAVIPSSSLRHRHDFDDVAFRERRVRYLTGPIDLFSMHHDDHALVHLHLVEKTMKRKPAAMLVLVAVDRHATPAADSGS